MIWGGTRPVGCPSMLSDWLSWSGLLQSGQRWMAAASAASSCGTTRWRRPNQPGWFEQRPFARASTVRAPPRQTGYVSCASCGQATLQRALRGSARESNHYPRLVPPRNVQTPSLAAMSHRNPTRRPRAAAQCRRVCGRRAGRGGSLRGKQARLSAATWHQDVRSGHSSAAAAGPVFAHCLRGLAGTLLLRSLDAVEVGLPRATWPT